MQWGPEADAKVRLFGFLFFHAHLSIYLSFTESFSGFFETAGRFLFCLLLVPISSDGFEFWIELDWVGDGVFC